MTAPPDALPGALRLPGGGWVRGRGLAHPTPEGPTPQHGLYLNARKHWRTLPWPHHWLDWPDFRTPRDDTAAITAIRDLHARSRAGDHVEVACTGGIGRTGTVIACLAVLDGLTPTDALAWTRAHHHRRAVETPWQRRWISRFPT